MGAVDTYVVVGVDRMLHTWVLLIYLHAWVAQHPNLPNPFLCTAVPDALY